MPKEDRMAALEHDHRNMALIDLASLSHSTKSAIINDA
jgi:hypothetical protein